MKTINSTRTTPYHPEREADRPNIGSSAIGIYPLYFCIVKQENLSKYERRKINKTGCD